MEDIYEKEIEQDYCDTCNKFVSDREIVGICPNCGGESTGDQCDNCLASLDPSQVLNKHCKTCGSILTTGEHNWALSNLERIG